ncbi:hypothetical protein [Variovorax sp. V15]|uniref:hypothetical protein n=1 Tax=Variovorax sp. V15 TaxID=3065952 RepID=UPI0034E8FD03
MSSPPVFSRRIQVTQPDAAGIWPILLLCLAYTLVLVAASVWLIDLDATGWSSALNLLAWFALFALWLVGLVVVVRAWLWLETLWRRPGKRRPKLFNENAQVDIDEAGLSVQGLGHVDWIDVLSLEGIPDSDNYLVVHTRPFGKLLLTVPVDDVAPVLNHYLSLRAAPTQPATGALQSRALVFCWRCFLAWIAAGYLLGGAAAIALLFNASDAGFLKTLVGLCVIVPLAAWLVWFIPLGQISTFAPSRVRAFELVGTQLRSTDGSWQADLQHASVSRRRAKGIGYDFSFIAIRPPQGKRLDLLLEGGADQEALLDALADRGLLPLTNPEL